VGQDSVQINMPLTEIVETLKVLGSLLKKTSHKSPMTLRLADEGRCSSAGALHGKSGKSEYRITQVLGDHYATNLPVSSSLQLAPPAFHLAFCDFN
jgi:hypothetical protein